MQADGYRGGAGSVGGGGAGGSEGLEVLPADVGPGGLVGLFEGLPWWGQVVGFLVVFVGVQWVGWFVFGRLARSPRTPAVVPLVEKTVWPARVVAVLMGLGAGLTLALQTDGGARWLAWWGDAGSRSAWGALLVLGVTWLVVGVINGGDDMILARYRMDVSDNLKARRLHTQVQVISRTLSVVVVIFGLGVALMQFDQIEQVGASLLASAGVAGIVIGFAARPVLGNIIAGVQIALTQPIRLDDAVVIEGEWGWIEEITTTYVVVKIWDQRRLIVPFSKIIEEPFQNWTRKTSQIIGTVHWHVDYTADLDRIRVKIAEICEGSERYDGRFNLLQVVETTERTMHIRALVTAHDSPSAWDLRCEVREGVIAFLRDEMPGALPREREERVGERAGGDGGGGGGDRVDR